MSKKQQNVLIMSDYQPHSGYAPLSQVEAYWEALREGRDMPRRAEIDPRGIESALEYAFILERITAGVARMRIAGNHLQSLAGMEVRGMPLTSFFQSSDRQRISDMLEEVFQTPAMAEISMTAEEGPTLNGRMILLPLKSDFGDVSRILGCLVSHGDPGASPRRFALRSASVRALNNGPAPSGAVFKPPEHSKKPENAIKNAGFQEPAVPFAPAEKDTGKKRPPYLRLIKSDD